MTFAEHPSGGLRSRVGPDLLSETGLTLLQGFLTYDPVKRVTADAALDHAYFQVRKRVVAALCQRVSIVLQNLCWFVIVWINHNGNY